MALCDVCQEAKSRQIQKEVRAWRAEHKHRLKTDPEYRAEGLRLDEEAREWREGPKRVPMITADEINALYNQLVPPKEKPQEAFKLLFSRTERKDLQKLTQMEVASMPEKLTVIRGGEEKREAVARKVESAGREWPVAREDPNLTLDRYLEVGKSLAEAMLAIAELGICAACGQQKEPGDFDEGEALCRECELFRRECWALAQECMSEDADEGP
jgi:hypothetical protein